MKQVDAVVRDRGKPLARLALRLAGWKLNYPGTPSGCGVIIAYPHTSNWDFVVGILAVWAIGIPLIFLGKDSLFDIPVLGWLLRRWGGIPVDRASAHGVTATMSAHLRDAAARGERKWLALSPEGTRKKLPYWRTGFYQIALAASVPLGLAYFNFARKEIGVCAYLMPSGNVEADLAQMRALYEQFGHGRHPEKAGPILFKPASD